MKVMSDFQSMLYKSMEGSKENFEVTLGRMLRQHQGHPSFYEDMLYLLGNIRVTNEKAEEYFLLVTTHKNYLEETIGHRIDFRVALMDYFLHIQPKYKNPTIVEISDFETQMNMAALDPLTGLFNRNVMNQYIESEISRSSRHGYRFSLILIDIDNFKSINDLFGHATGDRALKATSAYIEQCLRNEDSAFRYGGEEFILLLPHTDEAGLRLFSNRFSTEIAFEPRIFGSGISFSAGASCYPDDGISLTELIDQADKRMYLSKSRGKNQITLPSR